MDLDPVNTISLNSHNDSKITKLNLYTDRAQITRTFTFQLLAGQNKATISCLPNVMDHESLRVDGHGPATIQGVTSYKAERTEPESTSPRLEELKSKKERAQNTLKRAKKATEAIDAYMAQLDASNLDISKLGEAMDVYDTTGEKWGGKTLGIEKEIEVLDEQISKELEALENKVLNKKLRGVIVLDLYSDEGGDVSVNVIYAVSHARWEAAYDVRIDMGNPKTPARVVYKANITQTTGEDWQNAPITLETATPTFGVVLPTLAPWNVSHTLPGGSGRGKGGKGLGIGGAFRHRRILPDEDDLDYDLYDEGTYVTSKGHVNATFRIPGGTTVPSRDEERSVTIASLDLEATMSWMCIPKGDARVHLQATIRNSSEYTFLPGDSNVYVDQSFIARSQVPNVSPQEVFECPLGLDPSIRVTYHPHTKSVASSGFYVKYTTHSFTQRISIHNTKSIAVDNLKITDHVPVSQDANIIVKVVSPALSVPTPSSTPSGTSTLAERSRVKVCEGVVAQWNGADDRNVDITALGKNGKLDWVCTLPAFGKVNLLLQWEVSTSQKEVINGL